MVESGGTSHHHHHVRTVASAEDYPLDRLADPCNDRPKPDVPRPPRYPMNVANLFKANEGKLATIIGHHMDSVSISRKR